MTQHNTERLIEAYVAAINDGALERLEPLLAPNVVMQSRPHLDRFLPNVVVRLRQEREAFPDLHLAVERIFTDPVGDQAALVARWTGRRMSAQVCLLFEVEQGRISAIEIYGGLIKTMYDAGLLRMAS
jgi:ketosteroid isomerase-like protein